MNTGFRDGISQPRFFHEKAIAGDRWRAVLDEKFGSYMVFRKLEQNVKAFREQVRDLSKRSGLEEEVIEAQIVGRFRNGNPLLLVDGPQITGREAEIKKFDDFQLDDPGRIDYSGDPDGLRALSMPISGRPIRGTPAFRWKTSAVPRTKNFLNS
ncbi:MAG: hypothetical protein IPJ00_09365 [Saprospirales bacterium]|nr:hypothetical protein [Saprospirales bacterium]